MKGKPENRLLGHHFYNRPLDNNVVIKLIIHLWINQKRGRKGRLF